MESRGSTTRGGREPWLAIVAAAILAVAAPAFARAQAQAGPTAAMDGEWHFMLAPYMWMTGIEGDASVGPLQVPVDVSFSDLWDKFDFGLAGRLEGRKDRLGFGVDLSWNNLGAPIAANAPVASALDLEADVRQVFAEGFGFYRVAHGGRAHNPAHLDVLAGVRYTTTRVRLTAETSSGASYDGEFQDLDWLDAMAGLRGRAPLGSRFVLLGRVDVAGFGSNFTWNLEGDLAFRASTRWTLGAGWRHMDFDYDNGEDGLAFREYQLAYDGPRVWFAYSW